MRPLRSKASFGRCTRICGWERLEDRRTLDGVAPYVVDMAPQADGTVFVRFSEDVVNLDVADFQLTNRGAAIDLAGASLQSQSPSDFSLLLPELVDSVFDLRLVALDSEIADLDGNLLVQDASVQVLIANQPPSWQLSYQQTDFEQPLRRVAVLGDSLTVEAGGSYVSVLRDLLPGTTATMDAFANPNWKAEHLTAVWQTQVRDAGYDTIVVFAGVPDLTSNNSTADSIFQTLKGIYDDALAHGTNVICVGVSPWAQYKKWTPDRLEPTARLNTLISQYVADHSTVTRYVDTYALLGSSDGAYRLGVIYDEGDGLNLAPAGDERLARAVSTAILSLEPPPSIQQSAVLTFSRPVIGLSQSHLQLTHFGVAEPVQFVPLDDSSYRLDFTVPAKRNYPVVFKLDLTQGPITDQFSEALPEQTPVSFTPDYRPPLVGLRTREPAVNGLPIEHVWVNFDEPISTLNSDSFVLRKDGVDIGPFDLTITRVDPLSFDVAFQASQTSASGTYQLVFRPRSENRDSAGNVIREGALTTWVKLDVEPQVVGGVLRLAGTDRPDHLVVSVSPFIVLYQINGVQTSYSSTGVQRVEIDAGGMQDFVSLQADDPRITTELQAVSGDGLDRAYLLDSRGDSSFSGQPGMSRLLRSVATGFAQVTAITKGSQSVASFIDSSGADQLVSKDGRTTWKGPGFEITAQGFSHVFANSFNGGTDTADIYDSVGNDTLSASLATVTLEGPGYTTNLTNFSRTNVRASQGNDSALLVGTAAAERFVGQANNSVWSSGTWSRYLYGFDLVEVGSGGGLDQATIYDSPGADILEADSRVATLTYGSSKIITRNFPRANIIARTGLDQATFISRESAETFIGQPTVSSFTSANYAAYAYGFDKVLATSDGNDIAKLYGSSGDDMFIARPLSAQLTGTGFDNKAVGFGNVSAYAQGGFDRALIIGTAGTETVTGNPTVTTMVGTGFRISANRFAQVRVDSGGGEDVATLRDGPGTDAFIAGPTRGTMMGTTYTIDVFGYRRINAYASVGDNSAHLTGSIGNDVFTARPEYSVLTGAGFALFASGFGTGQNKVMAFGGGGTDIANLYDSAGNDRATIGYQSASLSGSNFNIIATEFDRTQLYASLGNDTALLSDSPRDDRFVGAQSSATLTSIGFVAALQRFDAIELADSQGGLDQVMINAIAYQLRVGLGWSSGQLR